MAKFYEVNEHPKERIKRKKAQSWKRKSKTRRRFFTPLEMAIISQDAKNYNGMKKRGEMPDHANGVIVECGCGACGCCVHSSFKSAEKPEGAELLKKIMTKGKKSKKKTEKDIQNELAISRNGFDSKTSFKK